MSDLPRSDVLEPGGSADPGERGRVEELMRALGTAIRNYRLYAGNESATERFVRALRERLVALWEMLPSVRLEVSEDSFGWEGERVYPVGDSGTELAFLFYRDGVREITLLPGLEEEVEALLRVLARAPQMRREEDDLLTLLWEEQIESLKYEAVEVGVEGAKPMGPAAGGGEPARVDPAAVRSAAAAEPAATGGFSPDDFQETLYFLDDAELRHLREEVRRESERDLWNDVLAALFDRLEDGSRERQLRIVRALSEVLPSMLGGGDFDRSAALLQELADLAGRPNVLHPDALREARGAFSQLSRPETVSELVKTLEGNPQTLHHESLVALLGLFPPDALAPLTRAVEAAVRPDVRRALEGAVQRLAGANREQVIQLLSDDDARVVVGAARLIAELGIGSATPELQRLLKHADAQVRLAAVEALARLRAAVAGAQIAPLLEDPDREVRVAAARALASLEVTVARAPLEVALGSKRLRSADRSERVAFFEAYGRLADAEGVQVLARVLNGRGWLGRSGSTEERVCAAFGLARARHPAARAALSSAANDGDPVVRTTVQRALRELEQR